MNRKSALSCVVTFTSNAIRVSGCSSSTKRCMEVGRNGNGCAHCLRVGGNDHAIGTKRTIGGNRILNCVKTANGMANTRLRFSIGMGNDCISPRPCLRNRGRFVTRGPGGVAG